MNHSITTALAAAALALCTFGASAADEMMKKPDAMGKDAMGKDTMTMEQCKEHMAMAKKDGMAKKDDAMMKKDAMCADMAKKDGMMKKDDMMKPAGAMASQPMSK